jgi:hypothetical protein
VTEFDPERFEDKYEHYFPELQRAYRDAFETMSGRADSELVHAIDQQVLAESEPFYEDGRFVVELPADAADRVTAVEVDEETLSATLERFVAEIERELHRVFGVERPETEG